MRNPENRPIFNASPEGFSAGRESFHAFSSGFKPEKDPREEFDLDQIVDDTPEILLEAIEYPERQDSGPWKSVDEYDPNAKLLLNYRGPFGGKLEINKDTAEDALRTSAIRSRVVLTDISMDRSSSIDLDEEPTLEPYVTYMPEDRHGNQNLWFIEIPGHEMSDIISREESKRSLEVRFADKFNEMVRNSLREIIYRELLTNTRIAVDRKAMISGGVWGVSAGIGAISVPQLDSWEFLIGTAISSTILHFGLHELFPLVSKAARSTDDWYEKFFPSLVEIDRYARGIAFMKGKGRNLVRLKEATSD